MKRTAALLTTLLMAVALTVSATPATAQNFYYGMGPSGFGLGFGFGYNDYYRPYYRPFYRNYYRPYYNRPYSGYRSYYRRDYQDDYYEDEGDYGDDHVARCEAHYRSYDVETDSFLGYDGYRHRCRL